MDTYLSIIIATYNRKAKLFNCLHSLREQTFEGTYEVLVIDDGATDGTEEMVKSIITDLPYKLVYLRQQNKGPAAARNFGVKHASGRLCLFLDDDMVASKGLLKEHVTCHREFGDNIVCLGNIKFHPDICYNPFVVNVLKFGPDFLYPDFKKDNPKNLPFGYFVTANTSISKARLFEAGLFDESFPYPAYEDTEMGYRLKQKGLKIVAANKALAYHNHKFDLEEWCRRQINVGRSVLIFHRKHPEIKKFKEMVENKDGILDVLKSNRAAFTKLKEIIKRILANKVTILLIKILFKFFLFLKLRIAYQFCFTLIVRYYLVVGLLEKQ